MAIISIALGSGILIIVNALFLGVETHLRSEIQQNMAHIEASPLQAKVDWPLFINTLRKNKNVKSVKEQVSSYAVVARDGKITPILITSARWQAVRHTNRRPDNSIDVAVHSQLAQQLLLEPEDHLSIITADTHNSTLKPHTIRLHVNKILPQTSINSANTIVMLPQDYQQYIAPYTQSQHQLQIHIHRQEQAISVAHMLQRDNPEWYFTDWITTNKGLFNAITLQKQCTRIMIALLVAMGGFTLTATLIIVITERQRDIATLRTLGLSARDIQLIFIIYSLLIGVIGAFIGYILGVLGCHYLDHLLRCIEYLSGVVIQGNLLFIVPSLPRILYQQHALAIVISTMAVAALAAWYPARYASRIPPAWIIRYE